MKVSIFTEEQTQTARYAKALSHPVRVYILELLSKQACCYSGDLSDELPIAKSTLSQHLKELKEAGLIQGEIEAPKIKYCLNKTAWHDARQLIETLFNKEIQTNDSCSTEK
ncbi:ArsR/SmtB family transcription factor [Saccharicrinis sp. FJH2]|uniref:ArsR/SmtB family transcription factor n=1 Tax=Saccharicrinis sp. FJH65 TaxID=3344659 RepID=UPI0035F3E5D3